jgi:hypothetical protein
MSALAVIGRGCEVVSVWRVHGRRASVASWLDWWCWRSWWTSHSSSNDGMELLFSIRSSRWVPIAPLLLLDFSSDPRVIITSVCVPRSSKRRLYDSWRSLARYAQLYQAVKVVEDFWIPQDRCAPVRIDTPLQLRMRFCNLSLELRYVDLVYWWVS